MAELLLRDEMQNSLINSLIENIQTVTSQNDHELHLNDIYAENIELNRC